jgi:DNA-binding MarR family transcriptional regulator
MSRAQRPDVQVFAEIGIIDQLATTRIDRLLPAGISSAQFSVLNHLAVHGRAETPASLAEIFVVTKGAVTNILQRLEAAGLIAVIADASDGRRKRVSITPKGSEAYEASVASLRPMMESMREAFTQEEFQDALPFLKALRVWLAETRSSVPA